MKSFVAMLLVLGLMVAPGFAQEKIEPPPETDWSKIEVTVNGVDGAACTGASCSRRGTRVRVRVKNAGKHIKGICKKLRCR